MKKLIYGVGTRDLPSQVNGKRIKSYVLWINILRRCYDTESHPTYHDVTVCEEWLLYSNFHAWCNGNYVEGFQVDKDLKGGKVYGPETCIMLPKKLNILLAGNYPHKTLACAREAYYDKRITRDVLLLVEAFLK